MFIIPRLLDWFLGYLIMLFQMLWLYGAKWDGKFIVKDMEGDCHELFESIIPMLAWSDWGKHENHSEENWTLGRNLFRVTPE
jgi:hypothetical protein